MPLEIVQYYLDFKRSNKVQRANWTVEYTMPKGINLIPGFLVGSASPLGLI
jgi:hypothetical protein